MSVKYITNKRKQLTITLPCKNRTNWVYLKFASGAHRMKMNTFITVGLNINMNLTILI